MAETGNRKLPSRQELEAFLNKNLLGQKKAVEAIARQYDYFISGFKNLTGRDKKRPIGIFFFVGPSGVGKTEAGKLIAQLIHGSREAVTFVEMEGYKEKHNIAALIGAPPGYVGYDEPPVFSKEKLHAKIPGLKKVQESKSNLAAILEKVGGDKGSNVIVLSPLESLEYQERMQSIKINQFSLIIQEMAVIDESMAILGEEVEELEKKLNRFPSDQSGAKKNRKFLKKEIQRKNRWLEQFEMRKKQLMIDYSILLQTNWGALLGVRKDAAGNRQKKPEDEKTEETKPAASPENENIEEANDTVEEDPVLIIILDEMALAHPDIHDFFLHVFEEGEVALKNGEVVDFSKALICMNANIAAEQISSILKKETKNIGFINQRRAGDIGKIVRKELAKSFKPPFLNRIDEIVVFDDLSDDNLIGILDLNLNEFQISLKNLPLGLIVADEVKRYILAKAKQKPESQARAMLDEFKKLVKMPLQKLFSNGQIKSGQIVIVKIVNGEIKFFFRVSKK